MRDAYIILSHCAPWQINELAAYLADGGDEVFIHADAGANLADQVRVNDRIHLVANPVKVTWADWSMVQATLLAINSLKEEGKAYRYVHLISGQCLPAMPRKTLDARLDEAYAAHRQFMVCQRLPRSGEWGRDGGLHRVGTWYPRWIVSKYSPWHRWFWPYTNKWIRLKLRRPLYYVFRPFYGGAQWWSLTGDCVAAIAQFARKHPLFCYFYHHSFCSDESFFQTCMAKLSYLPDVVDDNKRFLKWPFKDAPSPMNLNEKHWPELWRSGAFFGRKFSMQPGETTHYLEELEKSL